jgi:hypothetical protein
VHHVIAAVAIAKQPIWADFVLVGSGPIWPFRRGPDGRGMSMPAGMKMPCWETRWTVLPLKATPFARTEYGTSSP